MENSDDVQFVENLLKQQGTKFTDFMRQTFGMTSVHANPVAQNSLTAISNNSTNVRTGEIMTKLFATLATLAVSGTVTFFIMKWLLKHLDPTNKEKEEQQKRAEKLLKVIGVCDSKLKTHDYVDENSLVETLFQDDNYFHQLTEYELCVAANLVDPLSFTTDWTDIGGLDDIAKELQETVILPFKRQKLFEVSKLLQAPKGVLLYGPPGCGKTMLAKATARAAGARFINLQVSSLVDKWYGESQKRAEAVFSLAIKLQPTIIFIDELDTFLRNRSSGDHEATAMIKTQFMTWWDGIMTDDNCQIIVMGATNRPQDVDAAILRRMPSMFHVGLPTKSKRRNILEIILCGEDVDDEVDLGKLSADTQGYSGSDLKELCRNAAICRVREYLDTEKLKGNCSKNEQLLADADAQLRPMLMKDFEISIKRMRESKYTSVAASTEIEID